MFEPLERVKMIRFELDAQIDKAQGVTTGNTHGPLKASCASCFAPILRVLDRARLVLRVDIIWRSISLHSE